MRSRSLWRFLPFARWHIVAKVGGRNYVIAAWWTRKGALEIMRDALHWAGWRAGLPGTPTALMIIDRRGRRRRPLRIRRVLDRSGPMPGEADAIKAKWGPR